MNAVYVIWQLEEACPDCTGALTEIGLEDGSTTQECRLVQLVGLVATRPGRR